MKKIMTTVMALTLALGMSVTAFGNDSVGKGAATEAVNKDGESVKVTSEVIEDNATVEAATSAAAKAVASNKKVDELVALDITVAGASEENPITITVAIPTVKAGDSIFAMHLVGENWVKETVTVIEDGVVKLTVTSCSPFVFYKETSAGYDGWAGVDKAALLAAQTEAGTTSPKTGDAGVVGFALIAVACGAALVFTKKKFA